MYQVADIILNFRTAYYLPDGTREERKKEIAIHYFNGWFTIDFLSTLPVSYISYFAGSDAVDTAGSISGDESKASQLRAMKALRLVRMSKMLRVARFKKMLLKYGDNPNLQVCFLPDQIHV